MRKALADTLTHLAATDDRIIFLTGDLGYQTFDEFHARFGPRYVNVGVAEAQMMEVAAGLALEGWRPFVYSIASFATARAFEQVEIAIGYHHLPVTIIGAGGGYLYAADGATHYAADDLGLMSLIPGMTVVAPADPVEVASLLPVIARLDGPVYLRVGKYGEPVMEAAEEPILGRARLIRPGDRLGIVTTGDMGRAALAAVAPLAAEGIRPVLYQMHTVKPLDTATLEDLGHRVDTLLVIEEHTPIGGLWSAISAWHAETQGDGLRLRRIGPPDAQIFGGPGRAELLRRIGCDESSIRQRVRDLWRGAGAAAVRAA